MNPMIQLKKPDATNRDRAFTSLVLRLGTSSCSGAGRWLSRRQHGRRNPGAAKSHYRHLQHRNWPSRHSCW